MRWSGCEDLEHRWLKAEYGHADQGADAERRVEVCEAL